MTSLADDTRWLDAIDQAALVATGQVTPVELVAAAIERIEATNPALNAVVMAWFDHARAVAADPVRRAGRFVPFTPPFNMSGQPAISLPLHRNADGLPIGVQLVAAYGREDVLVRVASQLEQAHPWGIHHP